MNLLQCCCKPLERLLVKQTSTRTSKFHPLSKTCCSSSSLLLFIAAPWKRTQINPTIYYTYGSKKKNKQIFHYCNYAIRKKQAHPDHLLYLWQQKKMDNYWIPFIVNVINDYHNNSRAMKGRQQEFLFIVNVLVATRLWKEGSKKKKLLSRCLWLHDALKF
jgi:hypothetical protein